MGILYEEARKPSPGCASTSGRTSSSMRDSGRNHRKQHRHWSVPATSQPLSLPPLSLPWERRGPGGSDAGPTAPRLGLPTRSMQQCWYRRRRVFLSEPASFLPRGKRLIRHARSPRTSAGMATNGANKSHTFVYIYMHMYASVHPNI